MMEPVRMGDRMVGPGHPPLVIAEMSGNHDGSLEQALTIVDAVAEAGAHALKLQTYTADTITLDVDTPAFRISSDHPLWPSARLYDLYERAHTPWEWHQPIFERARRRGLLAFSSPFDPTAVEFLEGLDVPAYKIASSEIVDLPLIRLAASTGKPVIISTGMATLVEIGQAVAAAREAGDGGIVVLGCTADYPASVDEAHVRTVPLLADAFSTVVGLSDHTPGIGAALAAIALGASVVEKHVTMGRGGGGVDAEFSLEPDELAALVREGERAWRALGEARIGPRAVEREGARFRRSLRVTRDVKAGETVAADNVRSVRPAGGLPPDEIHRLLGRTFQRDAPAGTPVTWDLV